MSTSRPEHDRSTRRRDGSRAVRWRLWAAMLGLALVPAVAGVFVTSSLINDPDPGVAADRARDASQSAAALLAREQRIESRLLVAAAEPGMSRLANGIDGAGDRAYLASIVAALRGPDGAVVKGACIVRSSDGRKTQLDTEQGASRNAHCATGPLRRRAIAAAAGTVTRTTSGSPDGGQRLLLATPLRSVTGRNSGVLSAEVDVTALFDRTRLLGGDAVSSMLVDMGSYEVVAATPATVAPAGGAEMVDLAAVEPHVEGILIDSDRTGRRLTAMGLAPTVVPLWSNGDGSRMSLLQLWPDGSTGVPTELVIALIVLFVGALVAAIVMVRYFVEPFERLADSKAHLQTLYREAREDSLNDGLTGLGNHRAFQEELTRQIVAFEQRDAPFSLVLMDLDDLKVVNDHDGHVAGDSMLESMAQTMRDLARSNDRLYRVGGDEFAMLMPDTDIAVAISAAGRLLHFAKRPKSGARPSPFSCGISGVPYFTRDRDMVYRQADAALYWAKRHGRGSVEVFDVERDQLPDNIADITGNAVQEVVTGKLLSPVFQPIVDLRTGQVLGFEGLIRPDPKGPLPDTARLFAAAAASGRTVELDLACLEVVVSAARAIGPDKLLTLNLSPRTLETKDFDANWLLESLVRNGISPSRVIVEMTERDEIDDLVRLRQTFATLQQYGLRLAADDVGAGNSGLRLLSQVQFDIVKIDLSLVHDGVRRIGSRAVLESLRDLAVSQEARIVAEGVETPKQLQVIRELHIGAGQGFLLGRPDASVGTTFVDVQRLESGLLVPSVPPVALVPLDQQPEDRPSQDAGKRRRDMPQLALPPAPLGALLEAKPGAAWH